MDRGPVLRRIYELILEEQPEGTQSCWREHIPPPNERYEVRLVKGPELQDLSEAEASLLEEIYQRHESQSRWDLVPLCHSLPQWQDPEGGALPIETETILRAPGQERGTDCRVPVRY